MLALLWFASAGARAVPACAVRPPGWWTPIEVALLCACLLAASGCSRRKPASEPAVQQPNRVPMRTQNTPSTNPQRPPGLAGAVTADMGAGGTDQDPSRINAQAAPTDSAAPGLAAAPGDPTLTLGFDPSHRVLLDRNASRSVGTPQTGHLEGGRSLASVADAHLRFLARTAKNGTLYGTMELIMLVRDAAAGVARELPGVPLTVGNLSRRGGGDISASVSHNSGRDADLSFYLLDARGKSVRWPTMLHCDDTGIVQRPVAARGFRFDTARNWSLVRHLLSHPAVVVQWIFVAAPLRNILLDHALRVGAPALLRQRARRVMVQPSDSSRHDDHFHVRIACPPGDKPACRSGPGRTKLARETQIDSLLHMYHRGSPAERRYAREILSVPVDGSDLVLPPIEK